MKQLILRIDPGPQGRFSISCDAVSGFLCVGQTLSKALAAVVPALIEMRTEGELSPNLFEGIELS
jgi:hypothetical protein